MWIPHNQILPPKWFGDCKWKNKHTLYSVWNMMDHLWFGAIVGYLYPKSGCLHQEIWLYIHQDKFILISTISFSGCSWRQKVLESTLPVYFSAVPVQTKAIFTTFHAAVCLSDDRRWKVSSKRDQIGVWLNFNYSCEAQNPKHDTHSLSLSLGKQWISQWFYLTSSVCS